VDQADPVEQAGGAGPAPNPDVITSTTDAESAANGDASPDTVDGSDPCLVVGPLGALSVDQVTDRSLVIGWEPLPEAVNVMLDGGFVDTVSAEADQYVIEHRPLLPPPLPSSTEFLIEITTQGGEPSGACASTTAAPPLEPLVGVYAPTGLRISDETPTSLTVSWDPREGADIHNLYLDGRYITYGPGQGSTTIGDETEFTFLDLEPGTTYEIGIRRVEGFNHSGPATIVATTPTE
jgi:hypothetical protein